ncbi:hypothetical protein F5Y02DRAFT_103544 [Annulohypoxylon stygium]|nr:hypothetical protein F5Y02DRAFT_103544 [Annulohypoxylon stygium]
MPRVGDSNEDTIGLYESQDVQPVIETIDASNGTTGTRARHSTNTDESPSSLMGQSVLPTLAMIIHRTMSSLVHRCWTLDIRSTIRFVVVLFSYLMGVATVFSVKIAPDRPRGALSSIGDDGYPMMVAQVAASMLSPLLFGIVSTRETSVPLRQKIATVYYLLLVASVL